ncbi:MAG: hypothetical protein ACI81T_004672 [Bacteroidia bacterium]|jgi:hypothetical protein
MLGEIGGEGAVFKSVKDISFSPDEEFVLILTEKRIYRWNSISKFIPKLEEVIDNESLREEVNRYLDEFNG